MAKWIVLSTSEAGTYTYRSGWLLDDREHDISNLKRSGVPLMRYVEDCHKVPLEDFNRSADGRMGDDESTLAFMLATGGGISGAPVSFFLDYLIRLGKYTSAEVMHGLIPAVFGEVSELPRVPSSGKLLPAFAVIQDNDDLGAKVAYWDFVAASGWIITTYPWLNPIIAPAYMINQSAAIAGSSTWAYSMGHYLRILQPGKIIEQTLRFGAGGNAHAWALYKSTLVQPTIPPGVTFTITVASGVHVVPSANNWSSVGGFGGPYPVNTNEWYAVSTWPGPGSGQNISIPSFRSGGNLNEEIARLEAGHYQPTPGTFPGSVVAPTNVVTSNVYGLTTLKLGL